MSGLRLGLVAMITIAGAGCYGDSEPSQPQLKIVKAPTKSGDEQTGLVSTRLGNDLRVYVTRDDLPANAVAVGWFTSEGSLNPTTSTTDADGIATTSWTLGTTAGTKAATATITGADGSPLAFTAAALATLPPDGSAAIIHVLGPDGGNRFEPAAIGVTTGTTVNWTWEPGALQHNVVPDDGLTPSTSGALADGPRLFTYTFTTPGVYRFYCANHGGAGGTGMSGTITVTDLN